MKSGLEDRNNLCLLLEELIDIVVSMKSGLEDRNNRGHSIASCTQLFCLNEVRPGRPEQFVECGGFIGDVSGVSMKSGLEDRNNELRRMTIPDNPARTSQ